MNDNKSKNRNLIEGIFIYAIGSFGTKILTFLIVPLYTYYISTSDMGVYDLLLSTVNLLTPIVTLQISDAAYRWIIREEDASDIYIRATLQVLFFNSIIAALLIFVVNLVKPFQYCFYFVLLLLTSRTLATIQKLLRGVKNQKAFAFSSILYTVVFLILNVIQICVLKMGVRSLFSSAIIANIIACIFIFIIEPKLRVDLFKKPNIAIIKEMLAYSAPLVPNQLNWWVINSADRYIVSYFLGSSANGILAIAHKFPTMLQVVLGLFNSSWQDVSIADTEADPGKYYTEVFKKLYKISFGILFFLIPFTNIFIWLVMSEDYKISAEYVPFFYLGTVFQGFSSFYGVGYLRNKQTKKAFSTSIYGAVVNAVISIILINFIGLQAAAVATFIGFLVMWMIREKQNRKELNIQYDKLEFWVMFTISLAICIAANMLSFAGNIILMIVGGLLFIIANRDIILLVLGKVKQKLIKK